MTGDSGEDTANRHHVHFAAKVIHNAGHQDQAESLRSVRLKREYTFQRALKGGLDDPRSNTQH